MKQVMIRRGKVSVEDVPIPMVRPGYVLVQVAYSLISPGTEVVEIEGSAKSLLRRAMARPDQVKKLVSQIPGQGIRNTVSLVREHIDKPALPGYSCSGVVARVGEGVTDIQPGDLVACAGAGYACHAETVAVPRNLVVRIPEGCTLRAAASVTLGAIALQGVRRADVQLGESVAVIGLGILGLLSIQLVKASGCQVIGVDLDERRVALGRDVGADRAVVSREMDLEDVVRQCTGGHGVDATIITAASGGNEVVQQAMEITRKKGKVVVVGSVGLGLKRSPFYEKELDFLISSSYGPGRYDAGYEERGVDYPYAYVRWTENRNMAEYLRLLATGKVALESVLERDYSIDEAPQCYEELRAGVERPVGLLLRYAAASGSISEEPELKTKVVVRSRLVSGRVRIAVIGGGSFAKTTHLPNLKQLSGLYHIRAIVSATGSNSKAIAERVGADYASTSYADVLEDAEVDAVLIATRHHLHAEQVVAALKAGKHVYCEKPLALREQELGEILACFGLSLSEFKEGEPDLSDLNQQPLLLTGFNRRFSPGVRGMKEIINERDNPLMVLYRVNAGYLPPDNWVHGPEGGGRLVGEACHMLDVFQFLVDAPPEQISVHRLSAAGDHVLSTDNASVSLRYADGSVCTLVYTSLGNEQLPKEYIEVFCDGTSLVLDDYRSLSTLPKVRRNWTSGQPDKGHLQALQRFAESIHSQGAWPISLSDQVRVSLSAIAAQSLAS